MAHLHYQTEAFVIGSTDLGEGHRLLTLFTHELGLVRAVARSVRTERSKLRFSLQEFAHVRVSLVRGRDVWRLTGAVLLTHIPAAMERNPQKLQLVARFALLLRRLLHGEEKNQQLFEVFAGAIQHLCRGDVSADAITDIEHLTALRLLSALGYRSARSVFQGVLNSSEIEEVGLTHLAENRRAAVAEINELLSLSQL